MNSLYIHYIYIFIYGSNVHIKYITILTSYKTGPMEQMNNHQEEHSWYSFLLQVVSTTKLEEGGGGGGGGGRKERKCDN